MALQAFPGAEGGGATATGGRGGSVIMVTNLNDSGAGSLRACLISTGARTCIFRVAGRIDILTPLTITSGNVTIAGQSAPGGGIVISGTSLSRSTEQTDLLLINASDVIVRYIRFRIGFGATAFTCNECGRGPEMYSGDRVIYDHVSVSWSHDDNFTIWAQSTVNNVTFSNSITAEGLDGPDSSKGAITGSNGTSQRIDSKHIDMHHNLFANNKARNPYFALGEQTLANNIIYNWGNEAGLMMRGGTGVDIVSNVFKGGPDSDTGSNPDDIQFFSYSTAACDTSTYCINGDPSIYIDGNIFHPNGTATDPATDNWPQMEGWEPVNGEYAMTTAWRRGSRYAAETYPITIDSASTLATSLLPHVGASRRLDCSGAWVDMRDTADARLITQWNANTGNIISNDSEVGGFPTLAAGTACTDTDLDGMPDTWEGLHGLNPNLATDRNGDVDADGYTNLEEYLGGPSSGQACVLAYPQASTPPTGYAASWSVASAGQELLLNASCATADINVSIGKPGAYTWNTGYKFNGTSWVSFPILGTVSGNWIQGTGTATLTDVTGTTFYLGYVCEQVSGTWKCGCSNSACASSSWSIQGVD